VSLAAVFWVSIGFHNYKTHRNELYLYVKHETKLCYKWLFQLTHHHPVVCFTTGPQPLPNRFLQRVASSAF